MEPRIGLLTTLLRAIDALLHPSLRTSGWDTLRRARLLIGFVLFLSPVVLREAIQGAHSGSALRVAAAAVFAASSAFVLFVVRRWGALGLATHVFVGSTAALAFGVGLLTGAPAPLLGLSGMAFVALLVGGRGGAVWVPITMTLTLSVVAARALGLIEPHPLAYTPVAQAIDAAIVCACTSGFAWMFVTSKERLFADLEDANAKLTREVADHSESEERARAANRSKSDFLANMSHEIRTPMTAIMGFGDLLLDEDLSPATRTEHVEIIRRNGKHLLALIDDILDLSKIEAGKMALENIRCSPRAVVVDVVSLLRVPALAKGLSLTVHYATPLPFWIQSDPTRLRQILMNLVSNAVKFTATGGITLTVRCSDPRAATPTLSFDVADSGPGIAPDKLEQVFEPFAQADASTTRKFGGSGLGLAISKRLARALGGSLLLASTPGVGSKFTLTVETGPLAGVEMGRDAREVGSIDALSALVAKSGLRGRVLLAEDGPDNQALLLAHLTRAGATVTLAENGRAAVDKALEASAVGAAFDLVLMDMQMPEVDGYCATRELRAAGFAIPIVALTAHAMAGDREKCLAAGCNEYLTKPIVRRDLGAVLERYLDHAA